MLAIARNTYKRLLNKTFNVDSVTEQHKTDTTLKCRVAYNKHGGYCVPLSSSHRPVAKKILANKVHEPDTLQYMASCCAGGDIVHAGTYFGDFLPALSAATSPGFVVWAFEPNIENYRCAKITLQINGIENIVLSNAGLGAKQEYLPVQTEDPKGRSLGGASRIVDSESNEVRGARMIKIVAIDDIVDIKRKISIVQLDVEGYEKEALSGALKTIQRCLPVIILEVWRKSNLLESEWFSENILSLGYQQITTLHGNVVFAAKNKEI